MPITLPELCKHLDTIGWKYEKQDDRNLAAICFGTQHFCNHEGKKSVDIFIEIEAEGRYVQALVPRAYSLANCKFKGATLAALAELAFRTRSLQCEYDPSDGEVRYTVDTWVLDNTLTTHQVNIMVRMLVEFLEEYDPVIRSAMETGKVDFGLANKPESGSEEAPPLPPEIAELLAKAGGLEGLRAAVEQAQQQKK